MFISHGASVDHETSKSWHAGVSLPKTLNPRLADPKSLDGLREINWTTVGFLFLVFILFQVFKSIHKWVFLVKKLWLISHRQTYCVYFQAILECDLQSENLNILQQHNLLVRIVEIDILVAWGEIDCHVTFLNSFHWNALVYNEQLAGQSFKLL